MFKNSFFLQLYTLIFYIQSFLEPLRELPSSLGWQGINTDALETRPSSERKEVQQFGRTQEEEKENH